MKSKKKSKMLSGKVVELWIGGVKVGVAEGCTIKCPVEFIELSDYGICNVCQHPVKNCRCT